MPVKVRCPGCERVLNAPDRARGKAIKCPKCETAIRVPAQKKLKRPAARKSGSDSEEFLAALDLGAAEDTSIRLCQTCGGEVDPNDYECPHCEAELSGASSGSGIRRKKRRRRGPDPGLFYGEVFGSSWRFLMENKGLVLRTAIYVFLFSTISSLCGFMALYCHRLPPRVFWGFLALAAALVVPGWYWHLTISTIQATLEKQRKLKRVNFDIFQCMALGLKVFIWFVAFFLPMAAVAGLLGGGLYLATDNLVPLYVFGGMAFLIGTLMAPIAMSHMAMPVEYRGWNSTMMFPVFFKHIVPCLYAGVIAFGAWLIPAGALGATLFMFHSQANTFANTLLSNGRIARAQDEVAAMEEQNDAQPSDVVQDRAAQEMAELNVKPMIVPMIVTVLITMLPGVSVVFLSRVLGTFTFYFKRDLNVIGRKKEKKYVAKKVPDGGAPVGDDMTWKVAGMVAGFVPVFAIAGCAVYQVAAVDGGTMVRGLIWGLIVGGGLVSLIGLLALVVAAFKEHLMWGLGVLFVPFAYIIFVILFPAKGLVPFCLNLIGGFIGGIGLGMGFAMLGSEMGLFG